eukprot:GFUD01137800.1.p1 GENE.GFUD01137800.1~~GFUD01137800.1.p1  ORF type:complete len:395 (-),score=97.10 GFUD01137800.1:165-1349(-)
MMDTKISVFLIPLVLQSAAQIKAAVDPSCRCGERQFSNFEQLFSTRVIGGEEAGVNEFPWAALLSIQARGKVPERCGGSLINDRFVVTAAHCIPLSADMDITVYLGEHNTRTSQETTTFKTTARPYRYQKHWSYKLDRKKGNLVYDFALLELTEPVDWARYPHIRPVCLPGEEERDYSGEFATLVGWGSTLVNYEVLRNSLVKGVPSRNLSNSLQKLEVRLMRQSKCQDVFQEAKLDIRISESNLCAVSELGDSCAGDSGGGLFMRNQRGYYELVGVTSYGVGCNSSSIGLKIPGVYSRVSKAVNWIKHLTLDGIFCEEPTKIRRPEPQTATKTRAPPPTTIKAPTPGWSEWEPFSLCDKSCGIGKKSRDRYCSGSSCRHTQQTQERPCRLREC